ncbi:GDP-fucose protein O-fucosyltransferase 2 [Galleria mellonella]|uniref:GDP-fucose protein O-fucosyltransferase 2 n=1 Tax=Galleria mellonella TaxID=7137 RepID=A0A6J1WGH9_GALME|nr:GDP-fucose protein O-fucosyltransferase 2 [Galleria mellonella]
MHLPLIIITSLLISAASHDSDLGYCDISTKSCSNEVTAVEDSKLIFYDVNPPEGFNLRRDVYMRFAIMLSGAIKRGRKNWRLILPPFHRLYHWRSMVEKNDPIPWSAFFDVESLKSFAPVLEIYEIFGERKKIKIDTLYVLLNFEDPFENGVFYEKWQIVKECDYDGGFWGYKNITVGEIVCVRFQGKISKLWEIIMQHPNDKKVMFAHGEIPLHDSYGTKIYWDCRKSMKFNTNLIEVAKEYIFENLDCNIEKCESYISVHWRRQDFAYSRSSDVPSIDGTITQIDAAFKKHAPNIKKVFIASDAKATELKQLETKLTDLGYKVYIYLPNKKQIDTYRDGGIAIIEQIICAHSAYFIGTHESTFTFRIQEEREILGFRSSTTFNRLCPDRGRCERPSKWTIIN